MKKILAVDDSGMMLRTISEWLEGHYELRLANSAATAMEALEQELPDLMLLDYEMPGESGADFLGKLRNEPDYAKFANLPVFFLTARSDTEVMMSVMALRPEGFILKTTPPDQVINTIEDFFRKNGL